MSRQGVRTVRRPCVVLNDDERQCVHIRSKVPVLDPHSKKRCGDVRVDYTSTSWAGDSSRTSAGSQHRHRRATTNGIGKRTDSSASRLGMEWLNRRFLCDSFSDTGSVVFATLKYRLAQTKGLLRGDAESARRRWDGSWTSPTSATERRPPSFWTTCHRSGIWRRCATGWSSPGGRQQGQPRGCRQLPEVHRAPRRRLARSARR